MDFDQVLQDLGEFGTYQKMIVYLVLLPAVIPCGFHAYNQIFMSAKPDHWCKIPDQNLSLSGSANLSVPGACVYHERNHSGAGNAREVYCSEGWLYDSSKYTSTVVTEWDLVCENDFYPTLALVLFGVGGSIGNFVFGYIQDSLGRKIAFFLYLLIESVFGVASAFASTFPVWASLRFGVGFTIPAILESPYVLAVELVGPKKRAHCTILINVAYSLGLVILSGVVYLVRDWRQLTLVTTLPFLFLFCYWRVMPESPRWLYARGRFDESAAVLRKIAVVNGANPPANLPESKCSGGEKRSHGVMDLFKLPNVRKRTILITMIWFTNTAVYVGLSYYAPALGSDEFLSFFLAGVVELPTYIFLLPAMERFGRRWSLCLSMVTGGIACLATVLTETRESLTLLLYCLGKMGISCSFVVLPLMASELYPTVVRGVGISFSSVVGQIGPIFIPLINYLGKEWMVLPLIIMGGLLVAGGGLGLVLPETLHQPLPQTLEEAEMFGRKIRTPKCGRDATDRRNNVEEKRSELNVRPVESRKVQTVK